jgi:hypothetical protein
VAGSCKQVVQSLSDIAKLHAAIVKEYGEKDVFVNLHNGTSLAITFINSPLNAKDTEERAKRAQQTALFVRQHFPSINQIHGIWVAFVRQETRFIVIHYATSLDVFAFDKDAQPLRPPREHPASDNSDTGSRPYANYSPTLKQTEVKVRSLQLEGDLNYGLLVIPHYTVPGDVTGVKSSVLPRSVVFDFASYSEKSLFPGEPRITFLTDGKVVFDTAAQFSTSKGSDEKFFESLALEIPYAKFRRMIAGKNLILRIGDREYQFTDEQLQALQALNEYASE